MERVNQTGSEAQRFLEEQAAHRRQYQEKYADAYARYNEAYSFMRESRDETSFDARWNAIQDTATDLYMQVLAENEGMGISELHQFIEYVFEIDGSFIKGSYGRLAYMRHLHLTIDRRVVLGSRPYESPYQSAV